MIRDFTVSVVIPAYNEEILLPECLDALRRQSYQPDEIIVVDNNSSDATSAIAASFGARVIPEKRQGIAYARTAGFTAAQGDIIIRTDADCIALTDFIEMMVNSFRRDPDVQGVVGEVIIKEWYRRVPWFACHIPPLSQAYYRMMSRGKVLIGARMALRKDFWHQIAPFIESKPGLTNEDIHVSQVANQYGKIVYDKSARVICELRDTMKPRKMIRYLIDDARVASRSVKRKKVKQ